MTVEPRVAPLQSPAQVNTTARAAATRLGLGPWGLTLGLLAVSAFVLCFTFPANFDYWWHLAAGREIWGTGSLPTPDRFSFTAAGRRWIEHSWALEALIYGLYRPFGMAGPAALFASAFAAMLSLSALTVRGLGLRAKLAAPVLMLMLPIFLPYIGPRPQVFGFLLFATLIALVERAARAPGRRSWLIPVVFLVWANVHGSYIIGLGWLALLLACDAAAARRMDTGWSRFAPALRRHLALMLGLSTLAIAVNPAGPRLWLYPFTKLHNPWLQYIVEWQPTEVSDPRFWPFVLLAGGVLTLMIVRRQRPPLADLLLTGGLCFAALYGRRFIPFASLWLVVMYARVLVPASSGQAAGAGRGPHPAGIGPASATGEGGRPLSNLCALLAYTALLLIVARPPDPGARGRLPVAALDQLGAAGLSGPLFNDYRWGGYLIWRMTPDVQVFIDGRGDDLYMEGGVLPDYFRAVHLLEDPEPILARYGIRTVLFRPDTPFVRYLRATGRWTAIYEDDGAVVLVRARGAP